MFPDGKLSIKTIPPEQAKAIVAVGVVSCLNPSHKASIEVMESRFGVKVEIPPKAPSVRLQNGDRILVMGIGGLPRLENRHEYSPEEVAGAKFTFVLFTFSE